MRRLPIFLAAIAASLFAEEMLDSAQMERLNRYNHRASVGFSDRAVLKRFARIDKERAVALAQGECGVEQIERVVLKRKGRLLYYELRAPEGNIKINALDGTVRRCPGERR